jgi:hypothetical protein
LAFNNWIEIVSSGAAIGALISTGAFIQKSTDNGVKIKALEERVTALEGERVEVGTLAVKIQYMEASFGDLKTVVREGFQEIKNLLNEHVKSENCRYDKS